MKRNFASVFAIIALSGLTFVAGCSTPSGGSRSVFVEEVAAMAGEAAFIGTRDQLARRPDQRAKFSSVAAELRMMEAAETYTNESLYAAIGKLPVDELQGGDAKLAFKNAKVTFEREAAGRTENLERRRLLQAVVPAIRKGIERAVR